MSIEQSSGTNPERYESQAVESILNNLQALGNAVCERPARTVEAAQTERIDKLGKITWWPVGHNMQVRISQQYSKQGPIGVEIDGIFRVERGKCYLPDDAERRIIISVPRFSEAGHDFFYPTRDEAGEYTIPPSEDSGVILESDGLEMYELFSATMAEQALPILEKLHGRQ